MSETLVKEGQTEGKEVAQVSDEELAQLMEQNSRLQQKESEGDGVKADYILLAKPNTKALRRSEKDLYIEGLSIGDIFIQKSKLNLGAEIEVVPLAFITLYNERESTDKDSRFFRVWNKEQACQYPVADGSYFNRQLSNGHLLIPVNWVMVTVIGHHDIENAVIAFKSTGSRIWKKWKEDAKERSTASATLVYKIFEKTYNNDKYDWTDFGFEYVRNLLETDKAEALYCLKKSNAIRESYEKHTLIGDHDMQAVASQKVTAYISDATDADASDVEDSFDDETAGF